MHTFILEPGNWTAEGKFWDEMGKEFVTTGETNISHNRLTWKNYGTMTIHKDTLVSFENDYEIQPFDGASDTTSWSSKNPAIGNLSGHFAIVGDAITSLYESGDGKYKGHEVMLRKSKTEYTVIGAFYEDKRKLSSWNVQLRKV